MIYTDNEAISLIEQRNKIKFSEEQLKILNHRGGMYIVSCAGSGKTTVLVELITKRIMTGEIRTPSKLLLTTYSRAGADEMTTRINKQLEMFGIKEKVQVKTMHAFYLQVLRVFGDTSQLCYDAERYRYIRQACKDIKFKYDEEDIENLSNILSFQINNMMNDSAIYSSYVFNVEISLSDYTKIRTKFNDYKKLANKMDFDDMQFKLYWMLSNTTDFRVLNYCKAHWNSFYVDEFQDTNKIQFEILKKLVERPDQLVVIGDDDQCLVEGTEIKVGDNYELIENIKVGDRVACAIGSGKIGEREVESVSVHEISKPIIKITTNSGKILKGTEEHVIFREIKYTSYKNRQYDSTLLMSIFEHVCGCNDNKCCQLYMYLNNIQFDSNFMYYDEAYRNCMEILDKNDNLEFKVETHLVDYYSAEEFIQLKDIKEGMSIPVWDNNKFEYETVVKKEIINYKGKVYDLNISGVRNYIANNIVVHNCIYSWRGADPNIILNICAYYDIKKFYLSTNYRCREEILHFAETGVKYMYNREKKDMIPFKDGGNIEFMDYKDKDLYGIELAAFNYIKDMINGGTNPKDICVIVRNNAHAAVLSNMLLMNGIYCNSSKEIKLSTTPEFRDLESLIEIAGSEQIPYTYDKEVCCSMMWKLAKYLGAQGGNVIYEFMDNTGLNFFDTLEYILANYTTSKVQCKKKINLPKKIELKISTRCLNFKQETVYSLIGLYNLLAKPSYQERLEGLISIYIENMDFTLNDPNRRRVFEAFFKYVTGILKKDGKDRLEEVLNTTKQYEKSEVNITTDKVRLTTAHSSKGMEWKHVILLAYDNISFPPFKYIVDSLEKGVSKSDITSYIDGERRLAYVATTRAIDKLTIIGDFKNFSIFGLEALGKITQSSVDDIIGWARDNVKYGKRLTGDMVIDEENDIKLSPKSYELIKY